MPNLFVYGTLLDYPVDKIPASVGGFKLYSARAFPVAVESEGTIRGQVLMRIDDRTIKDFDHFECYYPDYPDASLYQRKEVIVRSLLGPQLAWIYYSTPEKFPSLQLIPHGSWERWENGDT
jgi:gamma-glutamylcyclotransferase (GGCT)/AIG2-like uncharacterized protein YtfP